MIHDTHSSQISQKQDGRNIFAIMKTMCPPGYHYNGFVAAHGLGRMIYGCTVAQLYIKYVQIGLHLSDDANIGILVLQS